jgi:hypothetical protein
MIPWKERTICDIHHYIILCLNFMFMWPCIVTNFFIIKPTRCTNFTNLFCHETTCFGQFLCPSSGVYSLYTQQWYVVQVCRQLSSRTRMILHLVGFIIKKLITIKCFAFSMSRAYKRPSLWIHLWWSLVSSTLKSKLGQTMLFTFCTFLNIYS